MMSYTESYIKQRFKWAEERIENSVKIAREQYKKEPSIKCIASSMAVLNSFREVKRPPDMVTIESDGGISFYTFGEVRYRIVVDNDGMGVVSSDGTIILGFNPKEDISDIITIVR